MSQHPHNMAALADLIQSADVYDCFDGNTVEVEIMLEYLEAQGLTPRHIYREVAFLSFSDSAKSWRLLSIDCAIYTENATRLCDVDRPRIV
jgi:E3 ubiquitin-protein ligase CHFR